MTVNRKHFAQLADGLAVALAAALPWSTTASGILAGLWLLAIIPTLDLASLRRVISIPAGGLPVLLVALGAVGMLWADVPWAERFDGVSSFFKLLFIPLLLHQFYRSDRAQQALISFLAACVLLLAVSWLLLAWPGMPWPGQFEYSWGAGQRLHCTKRNVHGLHSVILQFSYDRWQDGRRGLALALLSCDDFLANVFYIATSRPPLLLFLYCWSCSVTGYSAGKARSVLLSDVLFWRWRHGRRRRTCAAGHFTVCTRSMRTSPARLYPGRRTFGILAEVGRLYRKCATDRPRHGFDPRPVPSSRRRPHWHGREVSANPHNQIFAVGIQLGLVGIAVLLAMWYAHLTLFRSESFAAWVGLVVVVQNIVSSLFNSHLFDFTHGWAYVIGVGIAGGVVLKENLSRQANA